MPLIIDWHWEMSLKASKNAEKQNSVSILEDASLNVSAMLA